MNDSSVYNISVKRILEDEYGLLSEDGKVLEFSSEEEARIWGRDNIEENSKWISSWIVSKV